MSQTLTRELNPEIQEKLLNKAQQLNMSLETFVLTSLTDIAKQQNQDEYDPIWPLIGTIAADVNDVGENHDKYIQNILKSEEKF